MLRVYFDDELIDVEAYTELDNEYKLFTDTFKLGSVASNTFKLSVLKTAVNNQPYNVRIEDDDTVMHFIVDNVTEDDNFYAYTLTDKLLDFNFDYDASVLINSKAELEEDCYLSDIWKDMCLQAGVEYDETYVFENDIVVTWYDSRVQARKYLSYIAELQSGYACILENGKQSFKKQNRSSVKTIDADECSDLIVGEKKKITRVVYDGGAFKWKFGDETGDTLYLQSDNVYITSEQIVENIYNSIKDFEFYIIDVPNAPMDRSVRAGDIITISDNGVMYPTIAQYTMSYAGGWFGGYKLSVNTKKQQETQVSRVADNVRNLNVKVDRLNNEFGIIAEEITKLTDYIRNVGTTGNYVKLPNTPKSFGAINKLSIKGFELMPLYPGMAYPSEYTYPGVLSFYTLIFDTVSTFDNEPNYVFINSPVPLQKLGTVYDELIIEANKVKVIQRIGYDFDNEQWSILTTPIIHELNDVLLPTFDGDTYVKTLYFDNLIYDAEYLIKNDLTSNFSTQLESSSHFKMNQNEIEAKVNKDGIISSINLSPEEIKIKAEKIKLEGLVTANENFKILLDGSIEANKGTFKGDIFLPDGGRVIGGDGILTNLQYAFNNMGWFSPDGSDIRPSYWFLGYNTEFYEGNGVWKNYLMADIDIPKNFTVTEAKIRLLHANVRWDNGSAQAWGYCRNLRAYKVTNADSFSVYGAYASEYDRRLIWSKSEIQGAFGANGFTAPEATSFNLIEVESSDISSALNEGNNKIIIQTLNAPGAFTTDPNVAITRFGPHTGYVYAIINIIGFMQ